MVLNMNDTVTIIIQDIWKTDSSEYQTLLRLILKCCIKCDDYNSVALCIWIPVWSDNNMNVTPLPLFTESLLYRTLWTCRVIQYYKPFFFFLLHFWIKILQKQVKNTEKGDFDWCLKCAASKLVKIFNFSIIQILD